MRSMTESEIEELTDQELINLVGFPKNEFDKSTWKRFRVAVEARELGKEIYKKCPKCGSEQMGLTGADYDLTDNALYHFYCSACGLWEDEEASSLAYLFLCESELMKLGMQTEQPDEGGED